MARKNTQRTFSIVASILSIITCCGLLSNAYGCSEKSTDSNFKNDAKVGWHLVNDVNQLKNGDKVTFTFNYNDNLRLLGAFNEERNRFDSTGCLYETEGDFGKFTINENEYEAIYFTLLKTDDYFVFKLTDSYGADVYLTANSSTSNTCKLSPYITEESKFNIIFNEDYAMCIGQGNKTSNCIKAYTTFFSLYNINSGNFPTMYKWIGNYDPVFYVDPLLEFNPISALDLNNYEIVQENDFVLKDGVEFIPVYEKDDSIYLPILNESNDFTYKFDYPIYPFIKKDNYLLSDEGIYAEYRLKSHEYLDKTFNVYCNDEVVCVTEYKDFEYEPDLLLISKDNYRDFHGSYDYIANYLSTRNIVTVYDSGIDEMMCDPEGEEHPFELCFYKADDEMIYFGAVRNRFDFDPDNEGGYVSYFLVKK